MKRAVILVANGVQDQEHFYPYYRLQEDGFSVDVAAFQIEFIKGKYGIPILPTVTFDNLKIYNYDLVFVPGGWECPEKLRQNPYVLSFLKKMHEEKKVIASICHGPWVLISAGIVKGKRMTCYKGMKDDLINAGAEYQDLPVVIDENFVTSPHYNNNPEFMTGVLKTYEQYFLANLVL